MIDGMVRTRRTIRTAKRLFRTSIDNMASIHFDQTRPWNWFNVIVITGATRSSSYEGRHIVNVDRRKVTLSVFLSFWGHLEERRVSNSTTSKTESRSWKIFSCWPERILMRKSGRAWKALDIGGAHSSLMRINSRQGLTLIRLIAWTENVLLMF